MTYIPPVNGGRVNVTIGGNTAGAGALVSSGTATLVGGNNITLSQNGNAITISGGAGGGAAGSNTLGISNLGNSAGISGVISGSALQYAFAGGNNVTLSQSINGASGTVTISGANQSVQTQNVHNVTLGGNTAGVMAQVSSGTLLLAGGNNVTLSQNGNAVTISAGAGGGGGGIVLANSETVYTSGTANLNVAGGAMTIASTTGQSFNFSVPQTSSLSGTGGINIVTNGSTISVGVIANTMDFYQNMDRGTSSALGVPFNSTGGATLMLQRLNKENEEFAAYITANTVLMNMSGSGSSNSSSAHTVTAYLGLYSDNTTGLSLINSVSSSWALAANVSNSLSYMGPRWLSFVASQWSTTPAFAQGVEYVFGAFIRATNLAIPLSYIGQNYMNVAQRSGTLGATSNANTTLAQGNYWNAMYSVATNAFPTVISSNQVNRNNATAVFMPHIVLNNRYSGTF